MTAAVSAVRPIESRTHARTHAHCGVCTTRETRAYIAGKDKQTEAAANGATEPPIRRPAFFAWCRQADPVGRSFHELSAALADRICTAHRRQLIYTSYRSGAGNARRSAADFRQTAASKRLFTALTELKPRTGVRANSSANSHVGMHVIRNGRAPTVLVSLQQPIKSSRDALANGRVVK